jgi:hypothetical protein
MIITPQRCREVPVRNAIGKDVVRSLDVEGLFDLSEGCYIEVEKNQGRDQ